MRFRMLFLLIAPALLAACGTEEKTVVVTPAAGTTVVVPAGGDVHVVPSNPQ